MTECKGLCCRGALVLQLTSVEYKYFKKAAAKLNVSVFASKGVNSTALLKFSDHTGSHCPMLDSDTSTCRIYEHRPNVCRSFPVRFTPGCIISEQLQ